MTLAMPIPNVTALVVKCWSSAETQARELLAHRYFDKDEEFITQLFHSEFRVTIEEAAGAGAVKQAFLTDLKSHFPRLRRSGDLERLASGVSATATLHPREVEGKTGGDLGLVLIRPNINSRRLERSMLIVDQDYRRGLLCQAKIKRRMSQGRNAQWGGFTPNQRKILPDRMSYLALLLYEYEDAQRRSLLPFQWQVCAETKFDDVEEWLKSDAFPDRIGSDKIIQLLGDDKVGTEDKSIIDRYIAPSVRDTLTVWIGWPAGHVPPPYFHLRHRAYQKQTQSVHVHRTR
jgi:hypothetical protein